MEISARRKAALERIISIRVMLEEAEQALAAIEQEESEQDEIDCVVEQVLHESFGLQQPIFALNDLLWWQELPRGETRV